MEIRGDNLGSDEDVTVVLQVDGEAREILEEAGGGVFAPPGDPKALAEILRALSTKSASELAAMGEAGRDYVGRHYLRRDQAARLEQLLKTIVTGRAGA